jgi:hypothetical protein
MVYGPGGSEGPVGSVQQDWSVQVEIHASTGAVPAGQSYDAALTASGLQDSYYDDGLYVYLVNDPNTGGYDISSFGYIGSGSLPYASYPLPSGDVIAQISYSSSTQTISTSYSTDGGNTWQALISFSVTASNADGGWGLADQPGASVGVNITCGSNGAVVAPGTLYFTNFEYDGLILGNWPVYTPPQPVITGAGTASTYVNTTFSYQVQASDSPTSYAATGLPAGVGINTTTGLISGTPTVVGNYTVNLTAANAGGTSAPFTLDISVLPDAPPVVQITSPSNGATFIGPLTIPLAATASSPDTTITKVVFYNGATKLATVTTAPYQYNWKNVAAGTYTLTAVATDSLKLKTTSAPVTITVNADVPPSVTLTSPSNGATYVGPVTVPLAATAASSDSTIAKVEFYNGTTKLATVTTAPYQYSWKGVGAGTYTLTAVATDALGVSTMSAPATITVNADVPPSVTLTSPSNGATYIAPVTVPLAATATSSDSTIAKVEFYNGATKLATVTTAPYQYGWKGVGAGTYTLTAVATDALGTSATSSAVAITVNP